MLLFQCYLQSCLLCPGDVGQTLGTLWACMWHCSAGTWRSPWARAHLGLLLPLLLRLQLTLLPAPRTPGSSTGCPGCHFGLLPPRNSFKTLWSVVVESSQCFIRTVSVSAFFSAVLSVFLMPLPVWPGLNLAPDRHFSINQRFASVVGLFWCLIKFTVSN